MRVLVVEDEKRLADALAHILENEKYMVDVAYTGNDGYDYAECGEYDVIVLDVMLPGMNGFEIVSELRKSKIQTPVLMLTARTSTDDKVKGLDSGADDYMSKPFEAAELLARVRALSRRQGEVIIDEAEFGDLKLNLSTSELSCGSRSIHLNYKEFEILKLLMKNTNMVLTKEDLIIKVWGYDSDASDNNVEAYVSFIRKKFGFLKTKVKIVALRKVGYKLELGEED